MSFMRCGYPLNWFDGETKSYVILSSYQKGDKEIDFVNDYGDSYEDDKSFVELMMSFIQRETKDDEYTEKIGRVLAHKLGISDQMYDKKLSFDEWDAKLEVMMEKSSKEYEADRKEYAADPKAYAAKLKKKSDDWFKKNITDKKKTEKNK